MRKCLPVIVIVAVCIGLLLFGYDTFQRNGDSGKLMNNVSLDEKTDLTTIPADVTSTTTNTINSDTTSSDVQTSNDLPVPKKDGVKKDVVVSSPQPSSTSIIATSTTSTPPACVACHSSCMEDEEGLSCDDYLSSDDICWEEYAVCERLSSGQCGWTKESEFESCMLDGGQSYW